MWESDRQTESDTTGASCLSQSPFSTANTTHHLQEEVFCLRATSSDTEGGGDPNESCHSVERGALSTGTGKLRPWGQKQLIMLFNWLAKLGRNGLSRKHCQTRNWIMQLQNMNLVVWSCFLALHKIYAILLQKKSKNIYTQRANMSISILRLTASCDTQIPLIQASRVLLFSTQFIEALYGCFAFVITLTYLSLKCLACCLQHQGFPPRTPSPDSKDMWHRLCFFGWILLL